MSSTFLLCIQPIGITAIHLLLCRSKCDVQYVIYGAHNSLSLDACRFEFIVVIIVFFLIYRINSSHRDGNIVLAIIIYFVGREFSQLYNAYSSHYNAIISGIDRIFVLFHCHD